MDGCPEKSGRLSHRDVEAALFHLVFHIAATVVAHVAQHFGEHPFQRVVAYGTARGGIGRRDGDVAVVADIDGGAEEMAGVFGGIAVACLQMRDVVACAQRTGDDNLMEGDAFHIQRIEEIPADVIEKT